MGVSGLWTLLAPVGRPVQLENMEGKKMAIDSSIWLYQFQATMRDKDGRALVNAHILGFLRRICKLLFYGIRPVFVFDGGAPVLKKSTIGERKKKKEGAALSYARTAEKILAAQMRREALNRRAIQEEQAEATARKTNEDLLADAVYQEDLEGTPSPSRSPRKDKGKQRAVTPPPPPVSTSSPKKNKWHDHDPYKLPTVDMASTSSRLTLATAPDPRLATEDELREFIETMVPEDFDTSSSAFRSLPTEVQYEIIGDLRLKSRQTSYARLENMLASAPTALDFSKAQIVNLKQRNELTQKLLATVETVGSTKYIINPTRIASERNRQYVLVRNEGPDGGWVLGIKDHGTAARPIDVDEEDEDVADVLNRREQTEAPEEDSDDDDDDDDMEEIVPTASLAAPMDPDLREYQRTQALEALNARSASTNKDLAPLRTRFSAAQPQPSSSRPRPSTSTSRPPPSKPLFLDEADDDDDEVTQFPSNDGQVEDEDDDANLQIALQQSLEDSEMLEASELSAAIAESSSSAALPPHSPPPLPHSHSNDDDQHEHEREDLASARQFHSSRASSYSGSTYVTLMSRVNGPAAKFAAVRNAAMALDHAPSPEKSRPSVSPQTSASGSGTVPRARNASLPFSKQVGSPTTPTPGPSRTPSASRPKFSPSPSPKPFVSNGILDPINKAPSLPSPSASTSPAASAAVDSPTVRPRITPNKSGSGHRSFGDWNSLMLLPPSPSPAPKSARVLTPAKGLDRVPAREAAPGVNSEVLIPRPQDVLMSDLPSNFSMLAEPDAVQPSRSDASVPSTEKVAPIVVDDDDDEDDDMEEVVPTPAPTVSSNPPVHSQPIIIPPEPAFDPRTALIPSELPPPPLDPEDEFDPAPAPAPEPEDDTTFDAASEIDTHAESASFASFFSQIQSRSIDQLRSEIDAELSSLQAQKKAAMRDSDDITQTMVGQIKMLLRLFGIPFVTAPMEAEAQCAALVSMGLVEGIITDDSDVFLFGGGRVFRNMFNQSKTVECFLSADLERELGLDRETLIRLAYLLGSDYTEGVPGVGPVLAMELLKEFPGEEGLARFRDWWRRVQSGRDTEEESGGGFRKRFKKRFKDLHLTEDWPAEVVREAYVNPTIDESREAFDWGQPDLDALRQFLNSELGWSSQKVDDTVLPIIQKVRQRSKTGATNHQSTMEAFFDASVGSGTYAPRKRAPYASKRLQKVVQDFRKEQKKLHAVGTDAAGQADDDSGSTSSDDGGNQASTSSSVGQNKRQTSAKGKGKKAQSQAQATGSRKRKASTPADEDASPSASSSKATARKRKPAAKGASTKKKRRVAPVSDDDDEDEDEGAVAAPEEGEQDVHVPDRPLEVKLRPRPKPKPRYNPVTAPDEEDE